jgi:primosomal protein N' (replication factor Y)
MGLRRIGRYVPYYYLTQIVVTSDVFQEAYRHGEKIAQVLKRELSSAQTIILGPVVPYIKRIKNTYQTQLIIKYKNEEKLKATLEQILVSYNDRSIGVTIDMYPNFLV